MYFVVDVKLAYYFHISYTWAKSFTFHRMLVEVVFTVVACHLSMCKVRNIKKKFVNFTFAQLFFFTVFDDLILMLIFDVDDDTLNRVEKSIWGTI